MKYRIINVKKIQLPCRPRAQSNLLDSSHFLLMFKDKHNNNKCEKTFAQVVFWWKKIYISRFRLKFLFLYSIVISISSVPRSSNVLQLKTTLKLGNPSLSENTRGWTLNNWTLVTHNFWVFLSIIYYYILAIPINSRWILILGNSLFIIPDFPNPSIHYFFLLFNPVIYYSLFIFSFHPRKFM